MGWISTIRRFIVNEIQLSSEVIQLGNWFTYNDIENIKKMYKDGKSFEEIANVIGCTAIAIETTLTMFCSLPCIMHE